MTLETKKTLNDETESAWEAILTRRLADDLDAFLAADEAFWEDFESKPTVVASDVVKRSSADVKGPRFRTLATVASTLTALSLLAAAIFCWAPPSNERNETSEIAFVPAADDDKKSLLAWSLENFERPEWTRRFEDKLASADFFGICVAEEDADARESQTDGAEAATEENAESLQNVAQNNAPFDEEDAASESETAKWFVDPKELNGNAEFDPLKYEPFFRAVAASLR